MRDRNDIETRIHDAKQEAYDQKRKLALEEVKRQYRNELTFGEIAEAIGEFGDDGVSSAYFHDDFALLGLRAADAVDAWIDHQAEQEIQRRERKGEFV